MRIDKLLGNMGFGSRKEVRHLIRKGYITVNDQVVRDSGANVNADTDRIFVKETRVNYQKYIYLMMNKADGYISATKDAKEQTVIDLLPADIQHFSPFPVGRLDKDTEGLLLLTNDGELAHQLTSPKKEIPKVYYARINGVVTNEDIDKIAQGITLADGHFTKPAHLNILKSGEQSEIELTITEGKYHQVKRMFAALGKKVTYLKRMRMGDIHLDHTLRLGAFRELTTDELAYCLSLKENKEGI